jgi:predicted O-methyltransferase YrrM
MSQPSAPSAPADRADALAAYIARVYAAGELVGDDGVARPIRPTGVPDHVGAALRDIALAEGATRTVEVGLAYGLSTLFIAEALLRSGDPKAHHFTVDPLQQMLFSNAGLRAIKAAGVDDIVTHIDLSSDMALAKLLEQHRGEFDLAFVDGAHWFDYAFVDTFFCVQLVRPGGLVILDDTWMPGPELVVKYMVSNLACTEVADARLPTTTKRGRFGRRERTWPYLTILRTPSDGPGRTPDQFIPFAGPETVTDGMFGLARALRRRMRGS